MNFLLDWKKYLIGFGVLFAVILALVGGIILWDKGNVRDAKNERDVWWANHIATSPVQRDTQWLPQPKQTVKITNKHKSRTDQAIADSAFESGQRSTIDAQREQFRYVSEKVDTAIAFGKDTVTIQYPPLTHLLTVGLIRAPVPEITNTKMVPIPCPEIPFYDTRTAWYVYGIATVVIIYEGYHLATK